MMISNTSHRSNSSAENAGIGAFAQPMSLPDQTSRMPARLEHVMFTPEKLENRRLLSVGVKFDPTSGQLSVFGDGKQEEIRVTMINTEKVVDGPLAKLMSKISHTSIDGVNFGSVDRPGSLLQGVSVYEGRNLVFNSSLKRADVTNVDVFTGEGDDQITMYAWNSSVSSQVYAGAGDDTIWSTAGNSQLPQAFGEAGNDTLNVVFSDRSSFQSPDGGSGNDTIEVFGSPLYDPLPTGTLQCLLPSLAVYGGEGDDFIKLALNTTATSFGYTVFAGAGDDVVVGSALADQIYGEDG